MTENRKSLFQNFKNFRCEAPHVHGYIAFGIQEKKAAVSVRYSCAILQFKNVMGFFYIQKMVFVIYMTDSAGYGTIFTQGISENEAWPCRNLIYPEGVADSPDSRAALRTLLFRNNHLH